MTVQTTTCLLLTCNECGRQAEGFEDTYVVHFEDRSALEEYARDAEWQLEGDDATCWACRDKEAPEVFDR